MGDVLSLLYRLSRCYWGCARGDHIIERFCGRSFNFALGSLRMIRLGLYDESLLLVRGLCEVANLLALFQHVSGSLDMWKNVSESKRRREFSPVRVRIQLEQAGVSSFVSEERYSLLCDAAAHVHPSTSPNAHNTLALSVVGGALFQPVGAELAINETGAPLALVTVSATELAMIEEQRKNALQQKAIQLITTFTDIQITNMDEIWHRLAQPEQEKQ